MRRGQGMATPCDDSDGCWLTWPRFDSFASPQVGGLGVRSHGACVLRAEPGPEVRFMAIHHFDSLDALKKIRGRGLPDRRGPEGRPQSLEPV